MNIKNRLLAFTLLLCITAAFCFVAYLAGVNRTVARAAYVQSIVVQEEAKCFANKETAVDCLQFHWNIRAGAAAVSANASLTSWLPASMKPELQSYLRWVNEQPSIAYPSK
jgi:hypothetical protein